MALGALATKKALIGRLGRLGFQTIRGVQTFSHSLPDLPYDCDALEPVISAEIMRLHHQKHHQSYVSNYNKALEHLVDVIDKGDTPTIVRLQSAIKFNGGDSDSPTESSEHRVPVPTYNLEDYDNFPPFSTESSGHRHETYGKKPDFCSPTESSGHRHETYGTSDN